MPSAGPLVRPETSRESPDTPSDLQPPTEATREGKRRLDLGATYRTSGGSWRVIRREGEVIMARHEALDLWEVFVVGLTKAMGGYEGGNERPPGDEQWGFQAWTCQGRLAAEARFAAMASRAAKEGQ